MFLHQTDIKTFVQFIIYSNLWIAAAAASLCLPFYALNGLLPGKYVLGFVFASTWFIYTYQRFAKIKTGQHFATERKQWMIKYNILVNGSLWISGILAGILVLFLKWNTLIILVPASILSAFYVGRFLLRQIPGFRDLPFLKAYVVAIAWTAMLVFLPLMQTEAGWNSTQLWYGLALFLFIFALAVVFDLRDVAIDDPEMRTIPHLLGKRGTLAIAITALIAAMVIVSMLKPSWILPAALNGICGTILILLSAKREDDFFYSFWLDGYLFLPGICVLVYYLF